MESLNFSSSPSSSLSSSLSPSSVFFEKYEWRDVQELLSRTSCSWLPGGEDLHHPVDPPPGMIRQIRSDFHLDVLVLAPCDPGVCLDYRVVHQIIRELTVGIYLFNQVPSISLEPNPDQSCVCHLPPAYCDTKVGQILINIDYTMKTLWHGAYIPKEKRSCFLELWRSSMDPKRLPETEKDRIAEFLRTGVVYISDDPYYKGVYDEDKYSLDPTYDPDSADEKKLFRQYAENVLLKLTSYLTSVRQHQNLFTYEGTHNLSTVVRLTEDTLELSTYQHLQQRLCLHVELVKKHLGRKVELDYDLAYLKLITFLVPFLISLKKKKKIPDVSRLIQPFSDDLLKTERDLPPLPLRPAFSCKHFPYKPNECFHLHGGIELDVGTPNLEHITEEMKVVFAPLQNQALSSLKDLLQQDLSYKEKLPVPVSEIHGKSYSLISIALESFYPQPNNVRWWDTMKMTIQNMREQKLPLSDFQLYEQFNKTFGVAKAAQCRNVSYGLCAAAERGLSAVFQTLSGKNPVGHLGALDEQGYSLLHHAAMWNQPHIIYQLASAGVNLNQPCVGRLICSGLTPLHLAAQCGSLEALNCLIALQVDYRLTERRGWQAVHFSAFYGQVTCVQALCRTEPGLLDIYTSAEYGGSPLLLSAMSGSVEVLDYLLSSGANWRLRDSEGNNLVQVAALYFHLNILRRLIGLNLDELPVWTILVVMLQCEENRCIEMALRCMEALCVNADPYWRYILDAGGIAVLVDLLLNKRPSFRRMAVAVLCHMTRKVPVCKEVVRVGAVPVLIKHLDDRDLDPELSSRCVVILTDMATHSPTYQIQISEMAGVAPVVQLLTSDLHDVLVNAVRCIQALCAACPQNQTAVGLSGGVPLLVDLLTVNFELLQGEVCLALAEMAHNHRENQNLIVGTGAVAFVVKVLSSRKTSNRMKAARTVEALSHQNPGIQEHFLNQSTTRYLLHLLKVFDQDVREQGAAALWALAGHTRKQQKFIAELIGYRLILDLLLSTSDKMQYVGCQAVVALSRDCRVHQNGLCQENAVPPVVRLLRGSQTSERTLLSGVAALGSLCIGVAHTNNKHSQQLIHKEKTLPRLLELLRSHKSLQIKVSQTLANILLGNKELQTSFWEQEDFSYSVLLQLLQAQDRSIRLEAGHALALFAYKNPNQQVAILKTGHVPAQTFQAFLDSDDEIERAKAAFQTIVLAKVISGSNQVTLTARGVTILVKLLQSDTNTTVITAAEFLASLVHTRAGIPDAVVTLGAIEHLCTHLYSEDQEVRTACAGALGYLSFNRFAHRLLLVECRKNPATYRALRDNLSKDAKICCKFTSEFDRQLKVGLPTLGYHQWSKLTDMNTVLKK